MAGRRAIVTGAGSGLGQAMALALAGAGADVLLTTNRNARGLAETGRRAAALGRKVVTVQADLAQAEAAERLVAQCAERLGGVDILVNNAGMIARAPAEAMSLDQWEQVMAVNARAVFLLTQAAGRLMLQQGAGKVINVASVLSFQGGVQVASYAASKGAVAQMTKTLANEWAARGVNVNAIAPGYMRTPNTQPLQDDPVRHRAILERIPAGRWGVPEDLCGAVVFLAAPASDYVHGHVLVVDGGWLAR